MELIGKVKDFDGVVSISLGILNDLQYLASGVGVSLLEVGRSFGLTGKASAIVERRKRSARV